MSTVNDIVTSAEQQEGPRAIRALGFALPETLIANECALLVTDKATNLDSLEDARGDTPVDFRRRYELGKDRLLQAEEFQEQGLPLERADVEEQCT